jgi:hypothetical protein
MYFFILPGDNEEIMKSLMKIAGVHRGTSQITNEGASYLMSVMQSTTLSRAAAAVTLSYWFL